MRARFLLATPIVMLLGCPAEVTETQAAPPRKAEPQVDESDPRVVKVGDDLYAADALPTPAEDTKGKGSGKPDESNGYCRLYAPKLPEPHCCLTEYGFDAEAAGKACGKPLYLGESFQRSCGYFFHDADSGEPVWFRTSFMDAESPKASAEAEAKRLELRFGKPAKVEPVPGTPDAFQFTYNGISYAFMQGDPGWPNVRRLAWKPESCSAAGMQAVVAQMATAKPPAKGEQRLGLVPKGR